MTIRLWCIVIGVWLLAPYANASITAKLDRTSIGAGESVELRITAEDSDLLRRLSLDKLDALFTIAQRNLSQNVQIINGRLSRSATLRLTLFPKQSGSLIIPGLDVDGFSTEPLLLEVGQGTSGGANTPNATTYASVELLTDTRQIYVQQQFIVTLRIQIQAAQFIDWEVGSFAVSGAQVFELDRKQTARTTTSGVWNVYEQRFAVFAQQSGPLVIEPIQFQGILGGTSAFLSNYQVRSNRLRVEVLAPVYDNAPWLPAALLHADTQLSQDRVSQGQAITRTITLQAQDQLAEILPDTTLPQINGVQTYEDGVERNNKITATGVEGKALIKHVFIADTPGTFTIPQQEVYWYNTQTKTQERLIVSESRFVVTAPQSVGSASNTPAAHTPLQAASNLSLEQQPGQEPVTPWWHQWQWYALIAVLVVSLVGNLVLWRSKKPTASDALEEESHKDETALFTEMQNCDQPRKWQQMCHQWLQHIGAPPVYSAQGLCTMLGSYAVLDERTLLPQIEKWLYQGGEKPIALAPLLDALRQSYGYPRHHGVYNSKLA